MDTSQRSLEHRKIDCKFWNNAFSWIGVPFVHQQATRWGCDCVGLPLGAMLEIGYNAFEFDDQTRPINAISNVLQERVALMADEVNQLQTGALLLFEIGGYVQHLAIYGRDHRQIIHTDRSIGKVSLIDYPVSLHRRLAGIYMPDWDRILYSDIR